MSIKYNGYLPVQLILFGTSGYIGIKKVNSSYGVGTSIIANINPNGTTSVTTTTLNEGFRPVFLLSSNAVVSDGDGSREFPYVIE